jgi:hypothetical protein
MPFSLTDSTSGAQVLAASNSGGFEFGSATPAGTLTIAGKSLMNGSVLAPQTISPSGLNRVTGSVLVTSRLLTTVAVGSIAGFGSVTVTSGGSLAAFLWCGKPPSGNIQIAIQQFAAGVQETISYSVF